jgi:hypothetical protein
MAVTSAYPPGSGRRGALGRHAAEQISRLVGHSGTTTTETVYRKQIRPVLVRGADAMDLIFPTENHAS